MIYNNDKCTTTTYTTTPDTTTTYTDTTTTYTTTPDTTTTCESKDHTDCIPAFNFSGLEHSMSYIQETTQAIFHAIEKLSEFNEYQPDSISSLASDLTDNLYEKMSLIYGDTAAFDFCQEVRSAIVSVYFLRISFDSQCDELDEVHHELNAIKALDDKNREDD